MGNGSCIAKLSESGFDMSAGITRIKLDEAQLESSKDNLATVLGKF